MEQIVPACRSGYFGAREGGTAVLVGVPSTPVELNAADVLVNEKRFIGSIGGSCAPDHDFPKFLEWQSNGDRIWTPWSQPDIQSTKSTRLLRP